MAKKDSSNTAMTASNLQKILAAILLKTKDDYEIWLSSDEEGNQIAPMHINTQFSLCIDDEGKRVIFFPQH